MQNITKETLQKSAAILPPKGIDNLIKNNDRSLFMQLALVTAVVVAAFTVGLEIMPSYGQATSTTQRYTQEFESGGLPLCGGEEIQFSGTANFVYHTTVLPDGTSQINRFHSNYMQATAVGLTSGQTYVIRDINNQGTSLVGAEVYRTVINGVIATPGAGTPSNTGITWVITTTFNANGQPTSNVEFQNIRCVG